ncbi:MAG: glutamate--tRNA ligase [Planctomycetes bacterium]|nr:glutamate--tRNA ligase [Planctomycetota bacterium]
MSESKSSIVRTRFAPSPSGHLHVGGARTALFCWAYAKAHGGSFILRIEDTDQKRSSDTATRALLDDLAWLGIRWDEGPAHDGCGPGEHGPYFASQRLDLYHRYIDILLEQGKAYRAFEGPEQLEAARAAARAQKRVYRYDRAALKLDRATIQRYLDEDRPHVVRFKAPDEQPVNVHDEVYGEVTVRPEEIDDFVILKGDGYPTYHFAVVVDDELMGVTHVIRGQEHLYNTAKHVLLQDALGFRRPVYAHLSLIFNPDGSKMSKRDKDKALRNAVRERGLERSPAMPHSSNEAVMSEEHWRSWLSNKDHPLELESAERLALALDIDLPEIDVKDFRRAGYLPEVMVNYLALLGWSPGGDIEKFDQQFLIEHFDLDRVLKSPARFDRDKLLAFNLDALQAMSTEQFIARLRQHGERYHPEYGRELSDEQFAMFAAANHQRSKTLDDPFRSGRFFIMSDDQIVYEQSKAVHKALETGEPNGYAHLEAVMPLLKELSEWMVETLERLLKRYADERADGKLAKVAQPLRIAVTGTTVSPAIFETLAILGRDAVLNRIERCLSNRKLSSST